MISNNTNDPATSITRRDAIASAGGLLVVPQLLSAEAAEAIWTFDRLSGIGGHPTEVLGQPRLIDAPAGKAVQFDGIDDALFIENHPLAGAETFTWEVIFRPESEGSEAQRFFHLQERDPDTGADTRMRFLFETRLSGDSWCLDAFVNSRGGSKPLMDRSLMHPLDRWYHAAQVHDGKTYSCYVNGELQMAAEVGFSPQRAGHSSVGVRINKVDYFKGAVHLAKFSHRALPVSEFLIKDPRVKAYLGVAEG
jgi:concanavalin A-like lectin/glucanase superfamily protein